METFGTGRLSHHSNLACDFKRVLAGLDLDVGLLVALGSDERVDGLHLDVVKLSTSLLDHGLSGALIDDEHEGVVFFNGLDHALAGQWVFHDRILIPGRHGLDRVRSSLGLASNRLGLWESECHLVPDL